MTVQEILSYFINLRDIPITAENFAKQFGLYKYFCTYCGVLSQGNKRKLSFALALMGQPQILLLDEPSNCVDPESRRNMWKNINDLNKKNKNFNMILTTHSMEEAEVLCDRISWIKNGNIITIGNPEKLKLILNVGYKLHIKFVSIGVENNININNENNNNVINDLSLAIKDFNKFIPFIKANPHINPYLNELLIIILSLKENSNNITIKNINNDISFDFNIQVGKEKQKILFAQIFNIKTNNQMISQIDISTESLENILFKI